MLTRTRLLTSISLALLCATAAYAEKPVEPAVDEHSPVTAKAPAHNDDSLGVNPGEENRGFQRKLVFATPPSALDIAACEKKTRDDTLRALELLGALDAFQCRISEECLTRTVSRPIGLDLLFQDVVLGVPVIGEARLEGALSIDLAPSKDHLAFDVLFSGRVALKGTGRSQDVQIRTDTDVDFRAIKRVEVDQRGMSAAPATCQAKAAITTKEISSSRPKILGKFSERIAQRRTVTSKEEAEAQCADHLAEAVCEHLDREVAAVMAVVNAALAEHLKAADETARAQWKQIRFNTADEWIHIARASDVKPLPKLVPSAAAQAFAPLVLQLPRTRLDVNVVLTGIRYLQQDGAQPAASSHVAVRQPVKFRPVVELGSETITFRFEFDEPAKLAHDAPAPKTPTMP